MWTTVALCLNNICRFNAALHTNTDNKINKLVTVFALILCTLDNYQSGHKPGYPPLPVVAAVTVDNNWRASTLYRDTAPVHQDHSVTGDNIWRASYFVSRHS